MAIMTQDRQAAALERIADALEKLVTAHLTPAEPMPIYPREDIERYLPPKAEESDKKSKK